MTTIADHLNWRVKGWLHRRRLRAVLNTAPIAARNDGVILFSMIGTRVVMPYLVAAKTLAAGLGRGRFMLLDDGSLTDADRALIAHHLDSPIIISIRDVYTGPCSPGGTWERLLTILDLRADDYVIQFDSDTLAFGAMPELIEAVDANRSFTLRGDADAEVHLSQWFGALGYDGSGHVQGHAEAAMGDVAAPGIGAPMYVRGCSGFAGFARAKSGRALAEAFSIEMDRLIGRERWSRWGSEQVTSNFVIANEPDPLLLPYDRYLNFWGQTLPDTAAFVHFIGTCRFKGLTYLNATTNRIAALERAA